MKGETSMDFSDASIRQLIERAESGTLSDVEIDAVAQRLKVDGRPDSAYRLLYVLSRTRATKYETLVASFLEHPDNPMMARLALQTLCTFWGFSSKYLTELKLFAAGIEWDDFGDVRQVALSAAGEFLRDNSDCELFRIVFDACGEGDVDDIDERVALEALARALGKPLGESLDSRRLNEWRPELLAQGLEWLRLNCANP